MGEVGLGMQKVGVFCGTCDARLPLGAVQECLRGDELRAFLRLALDSQLGPDSSLAAIKVPPLPSLVLPCSAPSSPGVPGVRVGVRDGAGRGEVRESGLRGGVLLPLRRRPQTRQRRGPLPQLPPPSPCTLPPSCPPAGIPSCGPWSGRGDGDGDGEHRRRRLRLHLRDDEAGRGWEARELHRRQPPPQDLQRICQGKVQVQGAGATAD